MPGQPGIIVMIYLLIIISGAVFGSFFNVCISRIPLKKSIIFPSSSCPHCHQEIKPYNNIPIISYLLLKGRCRDCGNKIDIHYFLVELLTPILLILLFLRLDSHFSLVFFKYAVFISFGIIVFFIDLHNYIIPDTLSLPLIGVGLLVSFLPGTDVSFITAGLSSVIFFLLFLFVAYFFQKLTGKESLGGGDIKLIAGIGAFLGLEGTLFTVLFSSMLALVILLIVNHDPKKQFPLGPFLITGSFVYILAGHKLVGLYLNLFSV
ncbi:MAG: prepilin peptidase [Candidatus Cloacimonetes bacterium]|nr:prepilin peptidase [Candidatus Cloacimonadota bacterium]